MPSIQSRPYPLAFRVVNPRAPMRSTPGADAVAIRTAARALEGMQKEAVVYAGTRGVAWCMVSDEGPYLNGTDLAPFPLAFFTAGMAANYMSTIVAALKRHHVACRDIRFAQDNRYTMTGSAIKGTMTGGALPVELTVHLDADADKAALEELVAAAIDGSPVTEFLRTVLNSEFSLTVNGQRTATGRVAALADPMEMHADEGGFDVAPLPPAAADAPTDIIRKLESAQPVFGVDGGAGSSLSAEQDRTLHVRGLCSLRDDGLIDIRTQLLKPIGSVFRFLAAVGRGADGDDLRAPSGLVYLSAGIAFCYLTQIGRYAHIVKKPLDDYRLVQNTRFSKPDHTGAVAPVGTHVFVDTAQGEDYGRTLVDMGEQTCFLHAACRSRVSTKISVNS